MESNYKHIVLQFDQAQQPKFIEKKGKGWIEFGEENNYPNYLLSLYNESPKHGAIIKGKCNYIYGKGFENPGVANQRFQSFNKILKRCIADDEMYGGYYLQIIWDRLRRVSDIYHIEYHKVRANKDLSKFYVKNDWKDSREKEREYDAFSQSNPLGSQILFVRQYNAASDVYPLPAYFQALNYIESDIEVSRHILGNAKQGFVGSTLINLNNGDPVGEENKGDVEKALLKKFTGADGKRVVLMFNKSKENSADIVPLGPTMLTKEDFTNINNLIQQEIFAGHGVTSPMLFGIKTEGQLGGRSEIMEAYEIFNNTYVNERQQEHEQLFTKLRNLKGEQGEFKIIPVEPLKFEFSENIMAANLSRDEIREILGKEPDGLSNNGQPKQPNVNSVMTNISGRQQQGIMRIVRLFNQGKLTKEQAALQLKSGFDFTDEDVIAFLGLDDDPNTPDQTQKFSEQEDFALVEQFEQFGDARDNYEILSTKEITEHPNKTYFAEVNELTRLEANILNLISKDKRITPEVLAKTLRQDVDVISRLLSDMTETGLIKPSITRVGKDEITERTLAKPQNQLPGEGATTTEILLRYSYEGPDDDRTRPFCQRLIKLNRLYSRSDIETISERLGYSVWDRRGGWFTQPDGSHRPYCRHRWVSNIVLRKKPKK